MVEKMKIENSISVQLSCEVLAVSRSGYYDWLNRTVSERESENIVLLSRIKEIHDYSKETYGAPRITAALQSEGLECSKNRIARIMKENNIASDSVKKFKIKTTDSNHDLPIAPREFETENSDVVMAPNQVWVSDITYIHTDEGWLFLAIYLDIFTRKVVGFSCDDNMHTNLILNALEMALGRQDVSEGELIAHSDQGSQYASEAYTKKLILSGIITSMSRKGNCYDNAYAESFFHSIKNRTGLQK